MSRTATNHAARIQQTAALYAQRKLSAMVLPLLIRSIHAMLDKARHEATITDSEHSSLITQLYSIGE